ncbi:MAG: methyltransferase domain-containing protein [Nitrospinota bacterium]
MFDKEKIKEKFSLAAYTYNRNADLQNEVATEVARRVQIPEKKGSRVLDIGSGTGFLAGAIREKNPGLFVAGLDIAHGMSRHLKEAKKEACPITGDIEFSPFSPSLFEAVVSSFSMQWVHSLDRAFKEIFRVLKDRGVFSVALLGSGSFPELKEAHNRYFEESVYPTLFNHLPEASQIFNILNGLSPGQISVEKTTKIEEYESSLVFLKRLRCIGAENPFSGAEHKRQYSKLKKCLPVTTPFFRQGKGFGQPMKYYCLRE